MNLYYQSFVQEIQELIDNSKYQQVNDMIDQELAVPYVPQDVLDFLHEKKEEVAPHIEQSGNRHNDEDLAKWVHGTQVQQVKACSMLTTMNLRLYEEEVQALLDSDILFMEFKGELIEALMEQKIDTPYRIEKSGLEITFVPSAILPSTEDKTIVQTKKLFDTWFSSFNPAMYNFCVRLLEQEVLETRPFDFQGLESTALAKAIVRLVSEAMGQIEELDLFYKVHNLDQVENYKLSIEKRGENHEL